MAARNSRRRIPTDVYDQFPDDDSIKVIMFQADQLGLGSAYTGDPTDRHVVLYWNNGVDQDTVVTQLIQLTGNPGNYAYYWRVAKKRSAATFNNNLHLQVVTRDIYTCPAR